MRPLGRPGPLVATSESSPSPSPPHHQRRLKGASVSYLPQQLLQGPPIPQRTASAEEDLPFDQKPLPILKKKRGVKHMPFDEPMDEIVASRTPEASPNRAQTYLTHEQKLQQTKLLFQPNFEDDPTKRYDPQPLYRFRNEQAYEEFGLSPGSTATGSSRPNRPEDDDSLFDFEESIKASKSAARKAAAERRERRVRQSLIEDDETSVETEELDTAIKERTIMAFKVRRSRSNPMVSFDKAPDTVHTFQRDSSVEEEKSITSTYTKSMESEVEDVIKDLLFIGDQSRSKPGKRRIKDSCKFKRNLLQRSAATTGTRSDDDSTLNTFESATGDENSTVTKETVSTIENDPIALHTCCKGPIKTGRSDPPPETTDDPITSIYGYIEGSITSMTEALGLNDELQTNKENNKPESTPTEAPTGTSNQGPVDAGSPKSSMDEFLNSAMNLFLGSKAGALAQTQAISDERNANNEVDNGIMGQITRISSMGASEQKDSMPPLVVEARRKKEAKPMAKSEVKSQSILERDPRFAEMAVYTALNLHEVHRIPFDEKARDEVVKSVGFSVVKLSLPLGILFQENGGGCWVAKIFPEGNAAKRAKGKIKVGDQLAAIDGCSAVKMKVDDICSLISGAKNNKSIELVFLRYTGPLRPSSPPPPTEGYEFQNPSFGQEEETRRINRHSYQSTMPVFSRESESSNHSSRSKSDSSKRRSSKHKGRKNPKENSENPMERMVDLTPNHDTLAKSEKKNRFRLFGRGKQPKGATKSSF
eukprot:CAMPEP_0202450868 /NCGR_PEP_ID=MMETSP1360-20130828/9405_1 /ASSEMBLY_ACC=CAM_ASM_000848 /TAXON_ID=515479 /ORGANISM="Licmophora paradoxa, Strain CCMP2313" /LENGTH=760 /DNA_ID=CAMNT_0049069277 /DNA_START=6 /DNA_END=2288 /DNA_ORIENTATION=+